ncbi:MAG: hypothetical protein KY456_04550 [Chloroflexi bacterium]|nr:hypothetical protein [Chloroflexota bacterium]
MEHETFDQFVRALAAGISRRSMLRRAAGSAIASPLVLVGISTTAAQGKKDKDKGKEKDKGNQGNQGGPGGSGCRGAGHPCEGNQVCCPGLECGQPGPGNAMRCVAAGAGVATGQPQANQTVVNNSNQVCAGDCAQTNQQTVAGGTTQTVLVENQELFGRLPTYWVDVACTYDAPLYRTVCDCIALGEPGAPAVHAITLPPADICAFVITEEMRPAGEPPSTGANEAAGGEANAGTGGVANADASGGSVTVGNVEGEDNNIAIDASGGTANADASGGDDNIAIAGGGQVNGDAAQAVELSRLTLTLEGNVVPGKATTYWVETDAGRRPAPGAALVQVDESQPDAGAIIAEARICPIAQPQQGFDWFGQCTTPAVDMRFVLAPASPDGALPASLATNAQGRAHFGALAPGAYQLQPEGAIWCYAESDRVDANGNVLVEAGLESHVWSFVCGGPRGS